MKIKLKCSCGNIIETSDCYDVAICPKCGESNENFNGTSDIHKSKIENLRDIIAVSAYGKTYAELPDDGAEQDYVAGEIERRLALVLEEVRALGFKDAKAAQEHAEWLDRNGTAEFKAWLDENRTAPASASAPKYANTPHKTFEDICQLAADRVRAGEDPSNVSKDLIEGFGVGYNSAAAELIKESAWIAQGSRPTLAAVKPVCSDLSDGEGRQTGLTFLENGQRFGLIRYGKNNTITAYPVENLELLKNEEWAAVTYSEINRALNSHAGLLAALEKIAADEPNSDKFALIKIARSAIASARGDCEAQA